MFNIKKYFGRRSNNEAGGADEEITREAPIIIRGDAPSTTTFNRKIVIALSGGFALIFLFSMFYGMTPQETDKKKEETALKDKKVATTVQSNSQLDKLPSSYENKNQNQNKSSVPPTNLTGENSLSPSAMSDNRSSMRQPPISYGSPRPSYQAVDYSSPPPISGQQQRYESSASTSNQKVFTATVAEPTVSKEEQEVAEARKSPIRFNVK